MESALQASIEYLQSDEMRRSFDVDPYWPKWDSPWWHMTLMWQLGEARRIPKEAVERWVIAMNTRYLRIFPFTEEEVPEGVDPLFDVMCHCGLGTAYQVLRAAGVDVEAELPWVREWMLKYQMAEGGWNCDEAAYVRTPAKSSVVSTVPILEAMLGLPARTSAQEAALDRGVAYLLHRKLFRSVTTGGVIDQNWLQLTFPRFYEYDVLRGLGVVAEWSVQRGRKVEPELIAEAIEVVASKVREKDGVIGLPVEMQSHKSCGSRIMGPDGKWTKGESSEFELLRASSKIGETCAPLTQAWEAIKTKLEIA